MALKDNLTLQVGDRVPLGETADLDRNSAGRLDVDAARLSLDSSYGYYDPQFFARGGQRYDHTAGTFKDNVGLTPGDKLWQEEFGVGLAGVLPTGTRYELGGSLIRNSGERFVEDPLAVDSLEYRNIPWDYAGDVSIQVTQPLLRDFWIDAGRLNIKLRKQDLKTSELSFRLLTMDVLQRVALAYYDLVAARDEIKTREKGLELAQELVNENKKKIDSGTMSELEGRQAESQAATAQSDLTGARFDALEAENILKSLITHDFASVQNLQINPSEKLVPVFQSFNLPDSWRSGLENRPDYLWAKEEVESQNIVLKYRKNQLYPGLDLEAFYGRLGADAGAGGYTTEGGTHRSGGSTGGMLDTIADNKYPYYGGAVVLNFPLTFKSDRANYKRAQVQKESAVLRLKRVEDFVLQEIDTALKRVSSAYESTESTRAARKFAEDALDVEVKRLNAGTTTSFNVLQLQRDLTEARTAEITAAAEYQKALHQLYFQEGSTLQRNKVNLDIK